jgi:hypothetical protein
VTRAVESRDCSEDAADVKLAFGQNGNFPQRRDGGGSEESWLRRERTARKDFVATTSLLKGGAVSSPITFTACIRSNLPGLGWNLPDREKLLHRIHATGHSDAASGCVHLSPLTLNTDAPEVVLIYKAAHADVHDDAKGQERK